MKKFLALFNVRTLITVSFCLLASFITIRYGLKLHHNTMLIGLLVVFPLVKSFQFAFKRRERSLEYLSARRGSLIAIHYFFQHTKKLQPDYKTVGMKLAVDTSEALINHLQSGYPKRNEVFRTLDQISLFMMRHEEEISSKISTLVIRALKEVQISTSFLLAINTHRTVMILRVFAQIFIGLFSFIQAPTLNSTFGDPLAIYAITVVTGLVLTTLVNVQEQLENPFDQSGYDDIKLDEFRILPTDLINEVVVPLPGSTEKKKKDKNQEASATETPISEQQA